MKTCVMPIAASFPDLAFVVSFNKSDIIQVDLYATVSAAHAHGAEGCIVEDIYDSLTPTQQTLIHAHVEQTARRLA